MILQVQAMVFFLVFISISLVSGSVYALEISQEVNELAKKLTTVTEGVVIMGGEKQVYITPGRNEGVFPGIQFQIYRQGEPLTDSKGEIIDYMESLVADVEVERVKDRVSYCKVLNLVSGTPAKEDKTYQVRKKVNNLVVGEFTYNQGTNEFTQILQGKLVTTMSNKVLSVVERAQLKTVLDELKLQYSGLVDRNSQKEIGKKLGADTILLGTISDGGESITISGRMVDIETGNLITAAEVTLAKTPHIEKLLGSHVKGSGSVPPPLPPEPIGDGVDGQPIVKKSKGFTFELVSCKKQGGSAKCDFYITSDSDKNLLFNAASNSRLS